MKKICFYFFILPLFYACEKPLSNPEAIDPVYNDISSEISKLSSEILALEGKIVDKKTEIEKTEPQSGQYSYHRRRYWEMSSASQKLKQKKMALEIALQIRKKESRIKYSEAFIMGQTWPQPDDSKKYFEEKPRNPSSNRNWNVKDRIKKQDETTSH